MGSVYVLFQLLGLILLFFFPLGTIVGVILLIWGGSQYRVVKNVIDCPKCKEKIQKGAEVCKHCGSKLLNKGSMNKPSPPNSPYTVCHNCGKSFLKESASSCPYCRH